MTNLLLILLLLVGIYIINIRLKMGKRDFKKANIDCLYCDAKFDFTK